MKRLIAATLAALVVANAPAPAQPVNVIAGRNHLVTRAPTLVNFGGGELPPLPAGFFDPGSEPFFGIVNFAGQALNPGASNADTLVRRTASANLPGLGSQAPVPIEIIALHLVSVQPITVSYNGGATTEQWNVGVGLAPGPQQVGNMQLQLDTPSGGTFSGVLFVTPRLTFVRIGPPATRVLDLPAIPLQFAPAPWSINPPPNGVVDPPGSNFWPLSPYTLSTPGGGVQHTVDNSQRAAGVPTLSEWGLIVLGTAVVVAGLVVLRRRG